MFDYAITCCHLTVQHSFGKKKNFIKYKEKGSKIAVCSESGSNV